MFSLRFTSYSQALSSYNGLLLYVLCPTRSGNISNAPVWLWSPCNTQGFPRSTALLPEVQSIPSLSTLGFTSLYHRRMYIFNVSFFPLLSCLVIFTVIYFHKIISSTLCCPQKRCGEEMEVYQLEVSLDVFLSESLSLGKLWYLKNSAWARAK